MSSEPFVHSYRVIDNFLPEALAQAMRANLEAHFNMPYNQRPDSHERWNYWYVPELYTYFRTRPEKIMAPERVEQFNHHLHFFARQDLGMQVHGFQTLSMYIDGCLQDVHNDAHNGRFAYVYSLTKNQRLTQGGETILFHEGDPFRDKLRQSNAGRGFFDLVAPVFNRLVIFDDRLLHGVKRVEGSMDPLEARFVIHGHIEETGMLTDGPLPPAVITKHIDPLVQGFNQAHTTRYHGPVVVRFTIQPQGNVTDYHYMVDRVIGPTADRAEWHHLIAALSQTIVGQTYPPAEGPTVVTLPIMLGGQLVR